MTIKAVDLFCGVGGLTYGLQKAGIPVVAGIDIDVFFLEIAGLFIVTIGYGIFRFTLVHGAVHQYVAGNIRVECFVRPYGTGQTGILLVTVCIGLLGGPVFPFV